MGSTDEFGADGDRIRAWLAKRDSYADDARTTPAHRAGLPTPPPGQRVARTSAPPPDGPDANEVGRAILAAVDAAPAPAGTATEIAANTAPDRATAGSAARAGTDSTAVARSVVEALRPSSTGTTAAGSVAAAAPEAAPPSAPPSDPAPEHRVRVSATPAAERGTRPREAVAPQVQRTRWSEPADVVHEADASTDVHFTPVAGVRRALSLGLAMTLAFTALMGYVAYHQPSRTTVGVAAVAGVLSLVVWAVRAGAVPAQLSIERGQLVLRRNGRLEVVDLASPYTPIAVVGEPGLRGWAVLVERIDEPLIEITDSMVDPYWFTTALYRIRPELRPGAPAADQR